MRYELLLQPRSAGEPFHLTRIASLLVERGAAPHSWGLEAGQVELASVEEAGRQVATEVRIPLGGRVELLREALLRCADVASAADAALVDPQLGRAVTAADVEVVAQQYLRTARYAGEMRGVSEALGASYAPPSPALSGRIKLVLLALAGGLVALYQLVDAVLSR
jgi:hypothetical protein